MDTKSDVQVLGTRQETVGSPGWESADRGQEDVISVLLVDDRPEKLATLETILESPSLELVKAGSGMEALRQLLHRDFALILLDVNMPLMDGLETAALIRKRGRSEHTPIIFITAFDLDEALLARGYALGAVDFIFAPVIPITLKPKVEAFVDLHRISQRVARQAESLEANNRELEAARGELAAANELLEEKVRARTEDLVKVNQSLQREVAERKAAEESLKSSLREKEELLKEVHHRVKNNLQIISSLLRLQSGRIQDGSSLDLLKDSQTRIRSMALVHEKLYGSENLSRIDLGDYLEDLASQLARTLDTRSRGISLEVETQEGIEVNVDVAIPCGLVANELISNAIKHAFPANRAGKEPARIVIRSRRDAEGILAIELADNGVGIPAEADTRKTRSLGLKLVHSLVRQMGGWLEVDQSAGTSFLIRVPMEGRKEE